MELASRCARQALSAKAISTRSIPILASAAALAPRLAPTRLSTRADHWLSISEKTTTKLKKPSRVIFLMARLVLVMDVYSREG